MAYSKCIVSFTLRRFGLSGKMLRYSSSRSGDPDKPTGPSSSVTGKSNPSQPTIYETRKFGHQLPSNTTSPNFEMLPNIPTGIFRCTVGERLGPCADKCNWYKNPEYFSFQHMTYYDMHLILRCCRNPQIKSGRKP